jgi:hypothetical protein
VDPERRELLRRSLEKGTGALLELSPSLDPSELETALEHAFGKASGEASAVVDPGSLETVRFREILQQVRTESKESAGV